MKLEDEVGITKLITDYMCWWDDREQYKDYPAQLDENATWELWQDTDDESTLLMEFRGKEAVLASKKPGTALVHSTSNVVIHASDDDHAEARAYFRCYFRKSGDLFSHGEGRYEVNRIDGQWRLMAIKNQYYWRDKD
jgi:3-phenylpropionate/cinnamic acid dioxygenase small subunit